MKARATQAMLFALLAAFLAPPVQAPAASTGQRPPRGLAARYPHDRGIETDPEVVLVEDFGQGSVADLKKRWTDVSDPGGKVLSFSQDVPPGSGSRRSLQMIATRGVNEGGYLFKVFPRGYDRLYCRFYVKFAPDHGYIHHFVKMQGSINPPPWPEGEAGHNHPNDFTTGIEPTSVSALTYPFRDFPPPGIWHFYTYWPEMRSWQHENGTGSSFYGNDFEPAQPAPAERGRWICVEFMVSMNSSPDRSDGEQAFWIDGKPVGRFAPGSVVGYWIRDVFRLDPQKGKPFEGMRWRKDPRLQINKFWLLYYVTEQAFKMNDTFAASRPGVPVNTHTSTVRFADIVVARSYIGPIRR